MQRTRVARGRVGFSPALAMTSLFIHFLVFRCIGRERAPSLVVFAAAASARGCGGCSPALGMTSLCIDVLRFLFSRGVFADAALLA
eukprot:4865294-Alexandrium_andersonii.AAC.1